jgi:catalase
MGADGKARLLDSIVGAMASVPREIETRQIGHFHKADAHYGPRVAQDPGIDIQDAIGKAA